ncbi:DUF1127 domain-containing protein [Mesorhizobium sp. M0938]|uniref:DUF1127 domain-containing protein n=1 Tax=unclassified Mesorhizobium TaxID=325217 RepID=UPI003336BCD8
MAHTETRASKRQLFVSGLKSVAIAALRDWWRSVARRRALAELTPDQLNDIGHPEAHRPVLNIKAGLITKLMSMR